MRRTAIIADERGNVLFLILIAVALFAALAYAITSSSRSGAKDVSDEKAGIMATEMVSYANSISTAVTRLQVINGCEDTEISFETPRIYRDYSHSPPVSDKCKVFNPSGGDVPYQELPAWFTTQPYVPGYQEYHTGGLGVPNIGTPAADLIVLFLGIPENVCNAINRGVLGVAYSGSPPAYPFYALAFQGVYGSNGNYLFPPGSQLDGQPTGCYLDNDATNQYTFYHVLIER